jgi:hypothetical protein
VKPATPKAAPHQRWKNTTISFGRRIARRTWRAQVCCRLSRHPPSPTSASTTC